MHRLIPILAIAGCLSASAPRVLYPELPVTTYCQLIATPARFDGQLVRVKATYLYGFEQSEFTADGCDQRAWVEFTSEFKRNTSTRVRKMFESLEDPVEVVAVGVFRGVKPAHVVFGRTIHEGFGHLGQSDFKFEVAAVESVRVTHAPRKRSGGA